MPFPEHARRPIGEGFQGVDCPVRVMRHNWGKPIVSLGMGIKAQTLEKF